MPGVIWLKSIILCKRLIQVITTLFFIATWSTFSSAQESLSVEDVKRVISQAIQEA